MVSETRKFFTSTDRTVSRGNQQEELWWYLMTDINIRIHKGLTHLGIQPMNTSLNRLHTPPRLWVFCTLVTVTPNAGHHFHAGSFSCNKLFLTVRGWGTETHQSHLSFPLSNIMLCTCWVKDMLFSSLNSVKINCTSVKEEKNNS